MILQTMGRAVGADLDQVEPAGAGQRQGFFDGDDADLASVGIDETDRRKPNHLVDSCTITFVGDECLLVGGDLRSPSVHALGWTTRV